VSPVAALYVDPNGIYAGLPDVELWGEGNDARTYAGPYPVVAHPPCARWCQLAPLVQAMYGYKIGDDEGCFEAALKSVREWGGVLEHRPTRGRGGSTGSRILGVEAGSSRSPIRAGSPRFRRSPTGIPPGRGRGSTTSARSLPALDWSEPEALTSVSDFGPGNTRRRGDDWEPGVQYAEASATPLAFRDVLLELARASRVQKAAA
jgi:hypothetical protein